MTNTDFRTRKKKNYTAVPWGCYLSDQSVLDTVLHQNQRHKPHRMSSPYVWPSQCTSSTTLQLHPQSAEIFTSTLDNQEYL